MTYPVTLRMDPLGGNYLVEWATQGGEPNAATVPTARTAAGTIVAGSRAVRVAVSRAQVRAARLAAERAQARTAARALFGPQRRDT